MQTKKGVGLRTIKETDLKKTPNHNQTKSQAKEEQKQATGDMYMYRPPLSCKSNETEKLC